MSTLIAPDGTTTEIQPANSHDFTLDEAQALVGGLVQVLELPDHLLMLINEEGLLEYLPLNQTATQLWRLAGHGDPIVGPAVICRQEEFD